MLANPLRQGTMNEGTGEPEAGLESRARSRAGLDESPPRSPLLSLTLLPPS